MRRMEGRLRHWLDARWNRVPARIRRVVELSRTPPGHFYSPYPDLAEVTDRAGQIFGSQAQYPGIDLREAAQLEMLDRFDAIAADFPWQAQPGAGLRYGYDNRPFAWGDGLFLAAMLHETKPRRYIEVGSGWSTMVALDARDLWLSDMEITAIDPYPETLTSLLAGERPERFTMIETPVQDVDSAVFSALESGDVLMIDSTHVSKAGSDVHHLLFTVLPQLASGVRVHVHDVFANFEYPQAWVEQRRAWTESYLLRAFLQFNSDWQIVLFANWLAEHRADRFGPNLDPARVNPGAGLWIERR